MKPQPQPPTTTQVLLLSQRVADMLPQGEPRDLLLESLRLMLADAKGLETDAYGRRFHELRREHVARMSAYLGA